MNKSSLQYFENLKKHLPIVKDPTVIILRGHLLIEDLLQSLIDEKLTGPKAIQDARFTFYQKLCLCRGFYGSVNDDLWKTIETLNKLRNTISHKLPDETLLQKIDPVLKILFPSDYSDIPNDIYSKSKALRKGIIFQCARLYGFLEVVKAVKNDKI
jgi:hypothetical protein